MNVVVFVRSEYFEEDSSKYRLAISNETLIPSLREMEFAGHAVTVVLRMSPMDPRWSARRRAFESTGFPVRMWYDTIGIGVAKGRMPLVEVNVPDDIGLRDDWLMRTADVIDGIPLGPENVWINHSAGYWFAEDGIRECEAGIPPLKVRLVQTGKRVPPRSAAGATEPIWIKPSHQMMDPFELRSLGENLVNKFCWSSIHVNTLRRYCGLSLCTGTAVGATACRHRSKSVIHARDYRGGRLR